MGKNSMKTLSMVRQRRFQLTDNEHSVGTGLSNNKLLMWVFLGSECLLFGGLISTYLIYRSRFADGPAPGDIFDIPFTSVSSFVLLMSSLTMVRFTKRRL